MNTPPVRISAVALAGAEALYEQGRFVAAHALAAERHGPLAAWTGDTAALIFGSRLASSVGGERLAYALSLRARRRTAAEPADDPAVRASSALFHGYRIYGRRGPLALRRFLLRPGVQREIGHGATAETRADVLCLHGHVAAAFRDADAAESLWLEAHALAADRPWTWCERAALLTAADRYAEALEAANESLRLRPWYRPAVQQAAQILTLLARDDEAVALLEDALDPARGRSESPAVAAQLAIVQAELLHPAEALAALDRHEALSPLLEETGGDWLASRRAEARLQLGDPAGSADAADPLTGKHFFYGKTVPRLRDPAWQAARHTVLAVPFVRQHERTCAPATLAALTQYWLRPADHLAIAREICYGGTFDHQERRWTETHGWVAREFRVDWESAVALIDAGIPFTLATAGINSGHLQAVIGYDGRRGTLVIRDPFERNQREFLAEEFFAQHAFHGPRGMALVPADDAGAVERLGAAHLPEAALHDGLYRLRRALHVHDRPAARAALDDLHALDPAARLTLFARRELACYDGDEPDVLATVERLLETFPREGRLRLEKLHVLRRLARPADARAWLERCAADPALTEPNVWRELARELTADARQRSRARQLLARSLFYEPVEAEHLRTLGELLWSEREFAPAADFFRLAATAAAVREDCWQQYFVASRHLRKTDESFALLDARFRRLGDQSSQPARTLYWARRERYEFAPAAAVLDEVLARRRDDGDLLLFAATARARDGDHTAAADALAQAKGRVPPGSFARAAAELADLAGDLTGALTHWRAVLAREPLDATAHRQTIRLLEETDARGRAAAAEHLDAALARFPHAVALHELRIGALAADPGRGAAEHAAAVAALLAVQPTNVWAQRENVLAHAERRDLPAAFAALDEALRLDPLAPANHALSGYLLARAGRTDEAQSSQRRALELDANQPGALSQLVENAPTLADKRAALDFMHAQLVRQPWVGHGIMVYRQQAYAILAEPELAAQLEAILTARPDVWQAWSAVVGQHTDARRLEPAHERARAAVERFPLLPEVWLDLAAVERTRGDDPAQVAALGRALRINSAHGEASRQLAAAHRHAGRFTRARVVLEQAVAAAPLDMLNRGALAETLWQEDRTANGARALEMLVDAVRREPGYEWAWNVLRHYSRVLEKPGTPAETARQLTTTRPGEARSWFRLAQTLDSKSGPGLAERLAALERALALNPRLTDGHDLRAYLLATAGRYDEALAACEPSADAYPGGTRPFNLEGRAAWVLACRGDLSGARARMRKVLADHPGYEWGWRMLADWAEASGDQTENLAAAERLAFLDPHAAPPLGYLASARLRLKQRDGAKKALREAMRRDPTYLYAPANLLPLQLEDKDFTGAEETLAFFEKNFPGPATLGRTVLVAARRRQQPRAAGALQRLALTRPAPGTDDGDLPGAVRAVRDVRWPETVEHALQAALRAPLTSHPEAGACWVRSRADQARWSGVGAAIRRLPDGELARRARLAYLTVVTERRWWWSLRWFVWRTKPALRADTESWGQTGYALSGVGYHGPAVSWLSDWATRPDVQGWMMFNLAHCLRVLRRHRRAVEINRQALALPPDHTRPKHLVWVALEDALTDGDLALERARRGHEELAPQIKTLPQPFRYLGVLLEQILAVRAASGRDERRAAHRAAVATLRTERRPVAPTFPYTNRAAHRAERRARRRMARDAELPWQRVRLWVFSPPASAAGQLVFYVTWMLVILMVFTAATVLVARLATTG